MIDLRSDTLTKPSQAMLEYMLKAKVGDDVYGEDPTVKELEEKSADLFGLEAGLFCPSGTMSNQLAIKTHTQPGDEIICDQHAHVYLYEGGGMAFNSGCSVQTIHGKQGIFTASEVEENIHDPENIHYPKSRLVVIENTCNRAGGTIWPMENVLAIQSVCKKNKLSLHLDGARIFNALTESKEDPRIYGKAFDSISICLSKGLGAPVGSVLLGSKDFIQKARRFRKILGGGMRQAGYMAAAGIFALDHHLPDLAQDHVHAQIIAQALEGSKQVERVFPTQTNIVVFELKPGRSPKEYLHTLQLKGVLALAIGGQKIRIVTHRDVSREEIEQACKFIEIQ